MITYLESSVFDSPAHTLVNTVNTVGVMGKGIAKTFKARYPKMFSEYRSLCKSGQLQIGRLHLWRSDTRWVLNFPTKTTWRKPSQLQYVELGLKRFAETYLELGISSASFPPLGCGNGNLEWRQIQPMMEHHLAKVNIPIYIHNVHVSDEFVPEHLEGFTPNGFDEFIDDIVAVVRQASGEFTTSEAKFLVEIDDDKNIKVSRSRGHSENISRELIEEAWIKLRHSILSGDSFSDEGSKKLKSYLFPIFANLPYIRKVYKTTDGHRANKSVGLFLNRDAFQRYTDASSDAGSQGCLFH